MAVEINQINEREILVNEKLVVKGSDGEWAAKIELTVAEVAACQKNIIALES